jgi:spore maturation protein CgeB
MKLVVFGLAVSSSWGNGHATLWRGLARALSARGHRMVFFERDQPFYAAHRDMPDVPGMELVLYPDWESVRRRADAHLRDAESAMVTSYCPDAQAACDLVLSSRAEVRAYYDLDAPVTLAALERGEVVPYLPADGLAPFDVVLSYAGGRALEELRLRLRAQRTVALYGSVDPEVHRPAEPRPELRGALSYLGTYSADRQAALDDLLLTPAARLPRERFMVAGAQYPADFPWRPNVHFVRHLPPGDHAAFYASSPLTLNVTRAPMARLGHCPSGRLFEAAACGVPVLSDDWAGLDQFFTPGQEVLVARSSDDTLAALALGPSALAAIGRRARERALAEHSAARRAMDLERILFDTAERTDRASGAGGEALRCSG